MLSFLLLSDLETLVFSMFSNHMAEHPKIRKLRALGSPQYHELLKHSLGFNQESLKNSLKKFKLLSYLQDLLQCKMRLAYMYAASLQAPHSNT